MSKVLINVRVEETDWERMAAITGKSTDTEIMRELIQIVKQQSFEDTERPDIDWSLIKLYLWEKAKLYLRVEDDTEFVQKVIKMIIKPKPRVPAKEWESAHRLTGKKKFTPWDMDERTVEITLGIIELARKSKIEESRKKHYPRESEKEPLYEEPAELPPNIVSELKLWALERKKNGLTVNREILSKKLQEDYPLEASVNQDGIIEVVLNFVA